MGGQVPQGGEGCLDTGEEETKKRKWGASFRKFLGGAGSSNYKGNSGESIINKDYEVDAENIKVGSAPENYLEELASPSLKEEADSKHQLQECW